MRRTAACSLFACFLLFLIQIVPLGAAGKPAVGKRAFEVADVYRVAQASTPVVSPDGRLAAFSVKRYELEKGESWSEIWLAETGGSAPRQLTFGRHNDSNPQFSPDGKSLVFVSDRSGGSQLHLLPLGGGESRQLTRFGPGVADPVWSPDGRFLAVAATLYPDCGVDSACNEKRSKAADEGKLQVHVADSLLYRHWTSWSAGQTGHVLLVDAATGDVVRDLTPGKWDSPPSRPAAAAASTSRPTARSSASIRTATPTPSARPTPTSGWCRSSLPPAARSPTRPRST